MSTEFSSAFETPAAPRPMTAAPQMNIDIKRLLALRLPLMIGVAIVLAIPSALAGWFLSPLTFTATADLFFASSTPVILYTEQQSDKYDNWVNTQIGLITGNTILTKVLNEPAISDLPIMREQPDPLEFLSSIVAVSNTRGSELVRISCTLQDRDAAKKIIEETVAQYMSYALSQEASQGGERLKILMKERESRQTELDMLVSSIAEKKASAGASITTSGEMEAQEATIYREWLFKAEEALEAAKRNQAQLEQQLARVRELRVQFAGSPDMPIYELGIEDIVLKDTRIMGMRQELITAESDVTARKLKEGSPPYNALQRQIESIQASLIQLELEVRSQAIDLKEAELIPGLETAQQTVQSAEERVQEYQGKIDDQNSRMTKAAGQASEVDTLDSKATEARNTLQDIREKITQLNLESSAPARVQQIGPAVAPENPSYKGRFKMVILALMAACGAGVGIGVLRELADQQVRSPRDLARATRLPVIASIPHSSQDRLPGMTDFRTVVEDFANTWTAEEFRRIVARILYPVEEAAELASIMVTSPMRGDGKTSMACNVSIALSQTNRRVLIVDLNAQTPHIEDTFGLERGPGLAEVLFGEDSPEGLVRATSIKGLSILGPGERARDLSSKIASREMIGFLEWAEHEFDHVVIDTPAALLMSDAKMIGPLVDGVITVVGSEISSLGMIRRCLAELESAGARMLGVALNGIKYQRGGYIRKNLDLYYSDSSRYGEVQDTVDSGLPAMEILDESQQSEMVIDLVPRDSVETPKDTR